MYFRYFRTAVIFFFMSFYARGVEKTEPFLSSAQVYPVSPSSFYSITQTAYTLPQGQTELGLGSFHYGLTEQTMLSVATLALLEPKLEIMASYKFAVPYLTALTPKVGFVLDEYNFIPKAGLWMTKAIWLLDASLGLNVETSRIKVPDTDFVSMKKVKAIYHTKASADINLDYHVYDDGLLYTGKMKEAFYIGYTHRISQVFFAGVLLFGHNFPSIIAPYFYFRF